MEPDTIIAKGDRLDNFGEVWQVIKVRGSRVTMAREVIDPRDRDKAILVDPREFRARDTAHMRKL